MDKFTIIYLVTINVLSFILMAVDKNKARYSRNRTAENAFILLAIIGGSVGVYLAVWVFNHKTKKIKFTLGIPAIFLLELILILLYLNR